MTKGSLDEERVDILYDYQTCLFFIFLPTLDDPTPLFLLSFSSRPFSLTSPVPFKGETEDPFETTF